MSAAARIVALTREVEASDPLAWLAGTREERFYWERPADAVALASRGAVAVAVAEGAGRLRRLDACIAAHWTRIETRGEVAPAPAGPRWVGGFAFAAEPSGEARHARWRGFPPARFVLPELLLARRGGRCFATACARVETAQEERAALDALERRIDAAGAAPPATVAAPPCGAPRFDLRADRSRADFLRSVERALATIARGDLEKVVLARSVEVESAQPFDAVALLAALREAYPACASFAVARGDAVFLGATPERLLALAGRRVETAALAGTARRGRSPAEDARLAAELLESKKEQDEHAVVVRALRETLAPHCRALEVPEAPRLLRQSGIQHLETPVRAELERPMGLLALADLLHPTPAVGGAPRREALAWLARHEGLARGWYAGGVGHAGAQDGELVVALRSALLRGARAWCAAGAGIVAGSQPEAELRETRLKLRALLAPLLEL